MIQRFVWRANMKESSNENWSGFNDIKNFFSSLTLPTNKLVRLSVASFSDLAKHFRISQRAPLCVERALSLLASVKLGQNIFPRTNVLAYYWLEGKVFYNIGTREAKSWPASSLKSSSTQVIVDIYKYSLTYIHRHLYIDAYKYTLFNKHLIIDILHGHLYIDIHTKTFIHIHLYIYIYT
jgi:hypothetical protein